MNAKPAFLYCVSVFGLCLGLVEPAQAQTSTLLDPQIPVSYDRGRNTSVTERARPDYDALGIRAGSTIIFPKVDLGLGYNSNIYLTPAGEIDSAFAVVAPSARIQSDWSQHSLRVSGGGRLRRFFGNSRRDENEWYLNASGRYDLSNFVSVSADVQSGRSQEEPFASETEANIASLSQYNRAFGALKAEYRSSKTRSIINYDYTRLDFSSLDLGGGLSASQADRNRDVQRIFAQFEYATSTSTALYVQLGYVDTNYTAALPLGRAERDSHGVRAIAGLSVDFSGFFRGAVGVGYSERRFSSAVFNDVTGLSADARLEYFPNELTTVTFSLRRSIEDASIGTISAFFDNRAQIRIDREARRNLLVRLTGEYGVQDYADSTRKNRYWRAGGGATYLVSPSARIQFDAGYSRRDRLGIVPATQQDEWRALAGVTLQR